MRLFIIIFFGMVTLVSAGFCQVDTLMLVEINRLDVPGVITHLYPEDFNGDDIKELLICTSDYVYIFDSQTNDLLWTSPELINPQDIQFEDINNDSYLDFSVKDSLNIFMFDVLVKKL